MTDIPFGFSLPGGGVPDPNNPQQMAQFIAQLQRLFTAPGSGPVNWELAQQIAVTQVRGDDPATTGRDQDAVADALRLADLWLEPVTGLPSGIRTTVAWTRQEWVKFTLPVWQKLCDPVAGHMVDAMTSLVPEQLRGQLGPMTSMMSTVGGALFGGQLGQALASLAGEVLASSDIGLPLGPSATAALLPANVRAYSQGLEIDEEEVRLYVALREAAHQRLFEHVPWLKSHILAAVETYAGGIKVNQAVVEDLFGKLDPMRPETMQELNIEGVFAPEDTPAQKAALARLETILALVEGWVTHVVDQAVANRLPNAVRLAEAFRRRRAAGGPAEETFATLVGLELRPRRLREAAAVWQALSEVRGVEGRDALWEHPDLLPSSDDFADPHGFAHSAGSGLEGLDFSVLKMNDEPEEGTSGHSGSPENNSGSGEGDDPETRDKGTEG